MEYLSSPLGLLIVGAIVGAVIQYTRPPTAARRLKRHLEMRTQVPKARADELDSLINAELDIVFRRDRRWLTPRTLILRRMGKVLQVLGVLVALGALIYGRLQPYEQRLTDFSPEFFIFIGGAIVVLGQNLTQDESTAGSITARKPQAD